MVSTLSLWFLLPGFETRLVVILFFFFKNRRKDHWNVPAIQSTEWSLNGDWNATENHLSRHHWSAIQTPFSHHSVDWKVRCHPVHKKKVWYCLTKHFISIQKIYASDNKRSIALIWKENRTFYYTLYYN